ncbi:MAG TPA: hypothetical protein VGQ09_08255 [Chitinophagaceae bacterium]|jgi:hypothetical protein|nr:hypothetical protein [Chitinophagaceae bacterium]
MRKATLFVAAPYVALIIVFFNSCKKETSQNLSNTEIIVKVNSWLEQQKSEKQPNKAANIDLLKNNLDFSKLEFEKSDNEEQILIIPINESFKTIKKIDKNLNLNLLLIINKSGDIRKGNLVLYSSENGELNKIPRNTFYHIFNTSTPECNGTFKFLSVTGWLQYELTYKNNHLYSAGIVKAKENSPNSGQAARTETECIDWYLVTTYYYSDGTTDQIEEYIGRTCTGCDDPYIQGHCPDDPNVASSGIDYEYAVYFSENETQYADEDIDDAGGYIQTVYTYHATVVKLNNEVTSVVMYPITATPMWATYTDRYGRNVTRTLTLFGQNNYYSSLPAPTVELTWNCLVIGVYTYTDGSPTFTRQWAKHKVETR